jgi:hypothetical protein
MPEMHAKEAAAATNWEVKKWNVSILRAAPDPEEKLPTPCHAVVLAKQNYHPIEEGIDT